MASGQYCCHLLARHAVGQLGAVAGAGEAGALAAQHAHAAVVRRPRVCARAYLRVLPRTTAVTPGVHLCKHCDL